MSKTGILILALGNVRYSRMAMMLAASIKANGCTLPIAVAQDVDQISDEYRKYFDQFITIPTHCYTHQEKICYIKAKSHMNEISPFDETLFLDADIILINNGMINKVIDDLIGVDFAIKHSGGTPYDSEKVTKELMQWANLLEVKAAYGFTNEMIWNVHSEFIWWKKTKGNDALFAKWIETFETLKVIPIQFAGCIPDELPLWIAMCITGAKPHNEMFHPTYWNGDSAKDAHIYQIRDKYIGISIGGKSLSAQQEANYNNLCKIYQNMLGFPYVFKAISKKKWLPERQNY